MSPAVPVNGQSGLASLWNFPFPLYQVFENRQVMSLFVSNIISTQVQWVNVGNFSLHNCY